MNALPIGSGTALEQLDLLIRFLFDSMSAHRLIVRLVHSGSAEDRRCLQALRDADSSTLARIAAFFRTHQEAGAMTSESAADVLATNLFGMLYAHAVLAEGRLVSDAETTCRSVLQMFQGLMTGDAR